ncbi:hypothetical protein IHE45_20G017900 [Dioscorea alata]|uniref:Uncharacterized protein n=1 Tax=Dioscorea alata TaxID=55571 RepID=A0ACB7TQB4_DIOAL|nr:hypothetical protein IHE45_20G017900 [Dioscorea alata]
MARPCGYRRATRTLPGGRATLPLTRWCRPSPGPPGLAEPCASCPSARRVGAALSRPLHEGRAPTVPCRPRRGAGVPLSVGCGGGSRARRPPSLGTLPARPWRVRVAAGEPLGPWPGVGRCCRSRGGVARPPVAPVLPGRARRAPLPAQLVPR